MQKNKEYLSNNPKDKIIQKKINTDEIDYKMKLIEKNEIKLMDKINKTNKKNIKISLEKDKINNFIRYTKSDLRPYTKDELEEIKKWEDKYIDNEKAYTEYKKTYKYEGKKVSQSKMIQIDNKLMNNQINWSKYIEQIKMKPQVEAWVKNIKKARKNKEITKQQQDNIIETTEKILIDGLDLYRRNLLKQEEKAKKYNPDKEKEIINKFNLLNQELATGKHFSKYEQNDMFKIQPLLYENNYDEALILINKVSKNIELL